MHDVAGPSFARTTRSVRWWSIWQEERYLKYNRGEQSGHVQCCPKVMDSTQLLKSMRSCSCFDSGVLVLLGGSLVSHDTSFSLSMTGG